MELFASLKMNFPHKIVSLAAPCISLPQEDNVIKTFHQQSFNQRQKFHSIDTTILFFFFFADGISDDKMAMVVKINGFIC